MPVVIRELVVRAVVEDAPPDRRSARRGPEPLELEVVVAAVLEALRREQEP